MKYSACWVVCATGLSIAITGCDGGLLHIESTVHPGVDAGSLNGPAVAEFVGAGTVAANQKYKVVYTLGQATPNQAPITSKDNRLNGGIVGAAEGK